MSIKIKELIFLILMFSLTTYSQSNSSIQTSETNSEARIILRVNVLRFEKKEWELEFEIKNNGDKNIYLATNPTQLGGESGYYISTNEDSNSTINISAQVYSPPILDYYSNKTRVELRKLSANETFNERICLKFPIKETTPPYIDPFKKKKIFPSKIKKIIISIGYFEEEQGIKDFLNTKLSGWYINGLESLFSGKYKDKRFYEIQQAVSTSIDVVK
jgi:hypothetical protein